MHLVSQRPQTFRIGDRTFSFEAGETIHTENSYKYTQADFAALAKASGWRCETMMTDPDKLFGLFALRAMP